MKRARTRYFNPYRVPRRLVFKLTFRHPISGRQLTRGLGTRKQKEAARICRDLREICGDRALWCADYEALEERFDARAVEIFFSDPQAEEYQARVFGQDVQLWKARLESVASAAEKARGGKAFARKLRALLPDLKRLRGVP